MEQPVIIALDFPSWEETQMFLRKFGKKKLYVKVGMELFYQEGPAIITHLKEMGHQIFLDLKLHDIPNTVKSAMKGIAKLGVDLVNVHAAGGTQMMEAAIEGLEAGMSAGGKRTKCIAVTQLTSTSEKQMQNDQLILSTLEQSVLHYAMLAKKSGLDGVVSSVQEASAIKNYIKEPFLIITPGIRLENEAADDQNRIATPFAARKLGATGIVVGRSITQQTDPVYAYEIIKSQWELN
ncbi:orotidine-5'-phosphate decarboxylase [Caldibacillus lycopersici]|uniref:Orotidine 5'-phosphate decarboxylase n=1 Tax=Perspicuibacillus lycopersici TaxID=1325689 RepID=A0AAE3IRK0_9BACI|nr:orotidine-5'-phosphate decarboxylase [Perspicuibacillus lycopersici]MCU9612169.1 orotidine-5'-phosphate decarboxylase [Perspicuibacillus lycopersici]